MRAFSVLAIDDDPVQLELIATAARRMEYPPIEVRTAETVATAREVLSEGMPDMVVCDFRLPDGSGLDILRQVYTDDPRVPVVMITAHESVGDAVELMKEGARDYLVKPLTSSAIQQVFTTTLSWNPPGAGAGSVSTEDLERIGMADSRSPLMQEAIGTAVKAAGAEVSILIEGESGTGKELMARLIHSRSPRSTGPFVPVHIAALSESLVESELFGHRKGAFTGSSEDRVGLLEQAAGGTLFFDEIGEVPLTIQVKLLRAIQFREITRVGESQARPLDVRILAATNRNLLEMVGEGRFRDDLYYRLNVINLRLPALRDRPEDVEAIVEKKLHELANRNRRTMAGIRASAMRMLRNYAFPGNIRELENILERAVVLAPADWVTTEDLPPFVADAVSRRDGMLGHGGAAGAGAARAGREAAGPAPDGSVATPPGFPISLDDELVQFESGLIRAALDETRGHQSRAAEILGITERKLRSRMERLSITNPY